MQDLISLPHYDFAISIIDCLTRVPGGKMHQIEPSATTSPATNTSVTYPGAMWFKRRALSVAPGAIRSFH